MRTAANDNSPLYLSETAIANRVLGAKSKTQWSALAAIWEKDGLPRIDPLTGCRYWPAVREFLDRRHGLNRRALPTTSDGLENWN